MLQSAVIEYGKIFAWGLIILAVIFLLFRKSVENFFLWLSRFLIFPEQRSFSEGRRLPEYFFYAMYAVMLPVAAFMIYSMSFIVAGYYIILAALAVFILLKELLVLAIGHWTKNKELASALGKMYGAFFFLTMICAVCLYSTGMFFPSAMSVISLKIAPAIGVVMLLWYFIRVVKIFFAFRKSVLFAICYLCTFEILPVGLAVAIMIKY